MIDSTGIPQRALVLGAGSAIAQATVSRLVERGTTSVILAARRPGSLTAWIERLRLAHPDLDVRFVRFDALDLDSHTKFVESTWDDVGRIDLALVAFGVLGALDDRLDRSHALRTVQTNYLGAVSVMLPVAERMVDQGQGRIVVLSSVAAGRARATNAVYASTKAGLDVFADGLAAHLEGTAVTVTIVRPGFVATPMTEGLARAPFATTAEAVALDIVRSLERGTEVVWSPRQLRLVAAVLNHLPRRMYRRLTARR